MARYSFGLAPDPIAYGTHGTPLAYAPPCTGVATAFERL